MENSPRKDENLIGSRRFFHPDSMKAAFLAESRNVQPVEPIKTYTAQGNLTWAQAKGVP